MKLFISPFSPDALMPPYTFIFDDALSQQLKDLAQEQAIRRLLTKMLNRLELCGPSIGKLIDSHAFIYELKSKLPLLRLYFKHVLQTNEIYIFEFEMKTSSKKQHATLQRLRKKTKVLES